ncbi:hypothetical protein GGR60_000899 [Xanthomonas arboricola]|nr:hypothetical protein [Xanthomonas euroxanthea]
MKFVVVLEPTSAIGRSFIASRSADGMHLDEYPFIECSELSVDGPYLFCARGDDPGKPRMSRTSRTPRYSEFRIPHSAVAFVFHFAKEADRPVGFAIEET